jgi:hypothetical protein
VGTTGELRHHTTKGAVLVNRGLDNRGVDVQVRVDNGRGRVVTAGFDSEREHDVSLEVRRGHCVSELGPHDQGVLAGALVVVLANTNWGEPVVLVETLSARI